MNFDQVITIYRNAVDQTVTASEGRDWWSEVQVEIKAVITAPTKAAAAVSLSGGSPSTKAAVQRLAGTRSRPHPPGREKCFEITGKASMLTEMQPDLPELVDLSARPGLRRYDGCGRIGRHPKPSNAAPC